MSSDGIALPILPIAEIMTTKNLSNEEDNTSKSVLGNFFWTRIFIASFIPALTCCGVAVLAFWHLSDRTLIVETHQHINESIITEQTITLEELKKLNTNVEKTLSAIQAQMVYLHEGQTRIERELEKRK